MNDQRPQSGIHNVFALDDACVQQRAVQRIIIHPSSARNELEDSDIALLELASPVSYFPIQRLDEAFSPAVPVGSSATAAGWGESTTNSRPHLALHVQVPILDQASNGTTVNVPLPIIEGVNKRLDLILSTHRRPAALIMGRVGSQIL